MPSEPMLGEPLFLVLLLLQTAAPNTHGHHLNPASPLRSEPNPWRKCNLKLRHRDLLSAEELRGALVTLETWTVLNPTGFSRMRTYDKDFLPSALLSFLFYLYFWTQSLMQLRMASDLLHGWRWPWLLPVSNVSPWLGHGCPGMCIIWMFLLGCYTQL